MTDFKPKVWMTCPMCGKPSPMPDPDAHGPLTGLTLLLVAQGSLSPEQYDHFEAMAEHQPDVYEHLARAINLKLKESQ
jgi:hypothetical protein